DPQRIIGKTDYDLGVLNQEAKTYIVEDENVFVDGVTKQFHDTATVLKNKLYFHVIKIPVFEKNKLTGLLGIAYYSKEKEANPLFKLQSLSHPLQTKPSLLSTKERRCLYYLIKGKSAREIALALGLSKRTIEHHLENIKFKMNVTSKSELIEKAMIEIY